MPALREDVSILKDDEQPRAVSMDSARANLNSQIEKVAETIEVDSVVGDEIYRRWKQGKSADDISKEHDIHLEIVKRILQRRKDDAKPLVIHVKGVPGLGKTTTQIYTIESLFMATPTWQLAKQCFDDAVAAGKDAFVWDGWDSGFQAAVETRGWKGKLLTVSKRKQLAREFGVVQSDGRKFRCVYADKLPQIRKRGYQPGTHFCPTCAVNAKCKKNGYWSQLKGARKAQHVYLAFPEALFDPALKTWLRNLMPGKTVAAREQALRQRVGSLDDVPIDKLVVRRQVSVEDLDALIAERSEEWIEPETERQRAFKTYAETDLNLLTFLKRIRGVLANGGDVDALNAVLDDYADVFNVMCHQLARLPLYFKRELSGRRDGTGVLLNTKTGERFQVGEIEEDVEMGVGRREGLAEFFLHVPASHNARDVEIHRRYKAGEKVFAIGREMNVPVATIKRVLNQMDADADAPVLTTLNRHYRRFLTPQQALNAVDTAWWSKRDGDGNPKLRGTRRLFDPDNLPRVVDEEHGWLAAMLEPGAGIRRIETEGGPAFEVLLNPKPNVQTLIFSSATTNPEHVKAAFGGEADFEVFENETPEWKKDSRVYQLVTARYTKQSFVCNGEPGPRVRDFISAVWKEVKAGRKAAFIGRRFWKTDLKDRIKPLQDAGVPFEHFGAVIGRNDLQDVESLFITVPVPNREALESVAIAVYRQDFDTLDFETRAPGRVSAGRFYVDMPVFADARVQTLAEQLVNDEVEQAIMRLRLNINHDKAAIIMSGYPFKGLTDRADTIFFTLRDLRKVREIRDLQPRRSIDRMLADGDSVSDVAEAYGIPRSTLYHDSAVRAAVAAAKAAKPERDAAIRTRAGAGESQRAIAKAFNISRAQVQRILSQTG